MQIIIAFFYPVHGSNLASKTATHGHGNTLYSDMEKFWHEPKTNFLNFLSSFKNCAHVYLPYLISKVI